MVSEYPKGLVKHNIFPPEALSSNGDKEDESTSKMSWRYFIYHTWRELARILRVTMDADN